MTPELNEKLTAIRAQLEDKDRGESSGIEAYVQDLYPILKSLTRLIDGDKYLQRHGGYESEGKALRAALEDVDTAVRKLGRAAADYGDMMAP